MCFGCALFCIGYVLCHRSGGNTDFTDIADDPAHEAASHICHGKEGDRLYKVADAEGRCSCYPKGKKITYCREYTSGNGCINSGDKVAKQGNGNEDVPQCLNRGVKFIQCCLFIHNRYLRLKEKCGNKHSN